MREYLGVNVLNISQPRGKKYLLFPSIERNLCAAEKKGMTLLDLGCGKGEIASIATSKGYKYFGLDASAEMLSLARINHPTGNFIKGNAIHSSSIFNRRFDVIVASMLFLSVDKLKNVVAILSECKKMLRPAGTALIGITHPCFDNYMQSFLFQRPDTKTNFSGYFSSRSPAKTTFTLDGKKFSFTDFHWTLSDYVFAVRTSGMYISSIDECECDPSRVAITDKQWAKFRKKFPSYLLLSVKRLPRRFQVKPKRHVKK